MGYRWYSTQGIQPLFPFGNGLSYTKFAFNNLTVLPQQIPTGQVTVGVDVTNTGSRTGAEVAQVYLSDPPQAVEPSIQLRGFQKVTLQPGQTRHLAIHLDQRAFSIWNTSAQAWNLVPGTYTVRVGDSSANLPLSAPVSMGSPRGQHQVARANSPAPPWADSGQLIIRVREEEVRDSKAARVRRADRSHRP